MKNYVSFLLSIFLICVLCNAEASPPPLTNNITFNAVPDMTYGDPFYPTGASASSGLTLLYTTSNASVAVVTNGEIRIKGAGTVTITAKQPGNGTYAAAVPVAHTFTVAKADQTISFDPISDHTWGDASFSTGAASSSGRTVTYTTSDPEVATVSSHTITLRGAGTVTITANVAGNANYNAAVPAPQSFTVNKKDQTITFPPIADQFRDIAPFPAGATVSSGRNVTYTTSDEDVARIFEGNIKIKGFGTVTITAHASGNNNHNPAPPVSQTFSVHGVFTTTSGAWDDPSIWSCNCVPPDTEIVEIRNGGDVLLDDTARVADLSILSGGNLTMDAGSHLEIAGDMNIEGSLSPGTGSVKMNGTSDQTISGSVTASFYDLTLDNASRLDVTTPVTIAGAITAEQGTISAASASITLLSDASSTAKIGVTGSGGAYAGTNWIIQRYLPLRSAYWAYFSTPINGNTLNDWDQEIYMSGVGGNDGNACCPIFRSVRTYNESTNTYTNLTSVNTVLATGRGYMTWLSSNVSTAYPGGVMDSRGTPNFGDKTINLSAGGAGGGYNLVGNPYASSVNWDDVDKTNVGSNYLILQANGNYATFGPGSVIGPGQGFMAVATGGGATLTFHESSKSSSSSSVFYRAMSEDVFTLNLSDLDGKYGQQLKLKVDHASTPEADLETDMPFLESPEYKVPGMYVLTPSGSRLMKSFFPAEQNTDMPLVITAGVTGVYKLQTENVEQLLTAYGCISLEDKLAGRLIDLTADKDYSFHLEEGIYTDRFILHFAENGLACRRASLTETKADLIAWPNPAKEEVNLGLQTDEGGTYDITVTDMGGRIVLRKPERLNEGSSQITISTASWNAGVYFVEMKTGDRTYRTKFLRSR